MNSEEYYTLGKKYHKEGDWAKALECYAEAIALDKESPAVHAKEMLDTIMSYYCKDLYNP